MNRAHNILCGFATIVLLGSLAACNKSDNAPESGKLVTTEAPTISDSKIPVENDDALAAVLGASEIPYPVYPNGTKYRVGGENGLKIVVFQTEDGFEKVDAYYSDMSDNSGMPRIMAMSDYVRYSRTNEDLDPWATHLPGIVIHEFDSEEARQAVGAHAMARTNIIMSF